MTGRCQVCARKISEVPGFCKQCGAYVIQDDRPVLARAVAADSVASVTEVFTYTPQAKEASRDVTYEETRLPALPYRWGHFEGGLNMVIGVLIAVLGPIITFVSLDGADGFGAAIAIAVATILFGAFNYWIGSGIYNRKRGRIRTVQVMLIIGSLGGLTSLGAFISVLLINVPRIYYYTKRMDEFE